MDYESENTVVPEQEPAGYRHLPEVAQTLWLIGGIFRVAIEGAFLLFLISVLGKPASIWWVWAIVVAVLLALAVLQIGFIPRKKWENWRYLLTEDKIEMEHGVWIWRKILVPMKRVQHVDTRQGPIQKKLKLASVTVHTAATTHEIPALDEERAAEVRDYISQYTRNALEQYDL